MSRAQVCADQQNKQRQEQRSSSFVSGRARSFLPLRWCGLWRRLAALTHSQSCYAVLLWAVKVIFGVRFSAEIMLNVPDVHTSTISFWDKACLFCWVGNKLGILSRLKNVKLDWDFTFFTRQGSALAQLSLKPIGRRFRIIKDLTLKIVFKNTISGSKDGAVVWWELQASVVDEPMEMEESEILAE